MTNHRMRHAALAAGFVLAAGSARAQEGLARRVDAAPEGEIRISFASRPGVCGWSEGISLRRGEGHETRQGVFRYGGNADEDCLEGPVRVTMVKSGGVVTELTARVGQPFRDRGRRVTDLGTVDPREASEYLLSLAERGAGASKEALFPATLAQGVAAWPGLLRIARRESVPRETRSAAVFWLSQEAGEAATRGLRELVDDPDQEVRKQAVFSLSRRSPDEAVPELIRIARTHRDPEIRRTALFWLGRTNDPRALALFEELLKG